MRSFFVHGLMIYCVFIGLCMGCSSQGDHQGEGRKKDPSALNVTGDWNSGGGYALTDAMNPWWIGQSKKRVRFCILIDRDHFGQSLERSRELIRESIAYWKEELSIVSPVDHDGEQVDLTSFEFLEVDCPSNYSLGDDSNGSTEKDASLSEAEPRNCGEDSVDQDVDFVFQLGILSEKQKEYVRVPKGYLGLATRTKYDRKCLRAKGFIYISAYSIFVRDHFYSVLESANGEVGRMEK